MLIPLLQALARSLVLTLIFEGLFGLIWGVKGRRAWVLLVLVNVVTNPIVVTLHHCVSSAWISTAMLEVAAVIAEGLAYRRWGDKAFKPALLFALCANAFSFFIGVLLNYIL